MPARPGTRGSIDPAELEKFERVAGDWWNPDGDFRPLHKLNPVRIAYIRDRAASHFGRDVSRGRPLAGLRLVDIGCGGGILCEPMARLGAEVVGVDPAAANIAAARRHAEAGGLSIDYRSALAEDLAAAGKTFDIVLAMEVVEHVADRNAFLAACAALVRPGGLLFLATINRTPKAFALAIVGAEYLLRWLPRGTHDYSKLVRPAELQAELAAAGMAVVDRAGVSYDLLSGEWRRSADLDVNYMLTAMRQAERAG